MTSRPLKLPSDPAWERLDTRGRDVLAAHGRLVALIRAQAGVEAGALLAEPVLDRESGAVLGWKSPLGGDLVTAEGAGPEAAFAEAAGRIRALADRLDGQGEAGRVAAHSLRSALVTPEGARSLYVDRTTGAPVLVNWGLAAPGQERPVLEGAMPTGAAPSAARAAASFGGGPAGATDAMVTDEEEPAAPPTAPARRGALWWPWLVPASLAGVLAWVLVMATEPLPVHTVQIIPDAPAAEDPTLGLAPQVAALDRALIEVEDSRPRYGEVCTEPPEEIARAPEPVEPVVRQRVTPTDPPAAAETPEPATPPVTETPEPAVPPVAETPAEALEQPQEPAETETPAEPDVAVLEPEITKAPEAAPVPKPKAEPPVTVDRKPIQVPDKPAPAQPSTPEPAEPQVAQRPATPTPSQGRAACQPTWPAGRPPRMVFVVDGSGSMADPISGARSRMDAAKRSIGGVVRGLHPEVRAGVVSFSDCNATSHSKFYEYDERGQLVGRVNGMSPGRATSLAASISRAGAMASRRTETVIVVVSDGRDTCGRDPCAAARAVKSAKPNVRINVIDLSEGSARGVLQCVAQAGGGRVYTPGSAGQMASQVQSATGLPDASGC